MSDLIERLEAFQEKSEIYDGCDEDDEIWQDCGKYVLENLPAILSALKTVRGIEGLAKTADGEYVRPGLKVRCPNGHSYTYRLSDPMSGRIYCVEGECWSDGCQGDSGSGTHWAANKCTTLAAAVEAAGKKGEK